MLKAHGIVAMVVFVADFSWLANDPETDFDIIFAIFFPLRVLILAVIVNTLLLPFAAGGVYGHRRKAASADR